MTKYVFLDANFLLIPVQLKIDVYQEIDDLIPRPYTLVILQAVFDELDKKKERRKYKSRFSKDYAMARQILESKTYEILEVPKPGNVLVDDFILEQALKQANSEDVEVYVATNDKELKRKCKEAGVSTIYVRKGKRLEIQNY